MNFTAIWIRSIKTQTVKGFFYLIGVQLSPLLQIFILYIVRADMSSKYDCSFLKTYTITTAIKQDAYFVWHYVKNPHEESPGEQGIFRNGISYGDGRSVFEIPGKWRCKNGLRLLLGALSLVCFFGKAKKWTEKMIF